MLVAAGLGTRLAPLTDMLPKPAVPVANRAVAGFVMEHLRRAGLREFVANAYHLPDALEEALRRDQPPDASLTVVRESSLLGTGGGVRNALCLGAGESVLVANAKVLHRPDVEALMAQHASRGSFATMLLRPMPPGASFGAIDVDAEGRVQAILAPELSPGLQRCMFTGMHILSARAHEALPEVGCLIRQGYQQWLAQGEVIDAVVDASPFIDVGLTVATYHAANMDFCAGAVTWPGLAADERECIIAPGAEVHPEAMLRRCVVGEGARVGPGEYDGVVVWRSCEAFGNLRQCVVTPSGLVQP